MSEGRDETDAGNASGGAKVSESGGDSDAVASEKSESRHGGF